MNNTIKAKVMWFDKRDGGGVARSLDGQNVYRISAAGIPGKKTWYPHTACVFYTNGQEIELELLDEAPYAKCLTLGTFDHAKWNELDHDRLAFRCDENGKLLCGLFTATKT